MSKSTQTQICLTDSPKKEPLFGASGCCKKNKKYVLDWQKFCYSKLDKTGSLYNTGKYCADCKHFVVFQTYSLIRNSHKLSYCTKCSFYKGFYNQSNTKVVCMDAIYFDREINECPRIPKSRFETIDIVM
jgi:hypothetical protein